VARSDSRTMDPPAPIQWLSGPAARPWRRSFGRGGAGGPPPTCAPPSTLQSPTRAFLSLLSSPPATSSSSLSLAHHPCMFAQGKKCNEQQRLRAALPAGTPGALCAGAKTRQPGPAAAGFSRVVTDAVTGLGSSCWGRG
jgi:hypothetical protein